MGFGYVDLNDLYLDTITLIKLIAWYDRCKPHKTCKKR